MQKNYPDLGDCKNGEGIPERKDFYQLVPERRFKDDDLCLFPACQGKTDCFVSPLWRNWKIWTLETGKLQL